MTAPWQPHREPLRATLTRTIGLAVVLGAAYASTGGGGLARWPMSILIMLWPTFGGHWIELWFLNWLRPRLPATRSVQVVARLVVWFVGGVLLIIGMCFTALALGHPAPIQRFPAWVGGVAFVGLELVVQLLMQLRGLPNFYDGRG